MNVDTHLYTVPIDGVDGQDSVASDIGVSVFQTLPDGGHQWLQQLRLLQLTQEPQGGATDELIGVLQILLSIKPILASFTVISLLQVLLHYKNLNS